MHFKASPLLFPFSHPINFFPPESECITGPNIKIFPPKEIQFLISKLNPYKATGLNRITARLLCEASKKVTVMITYIFNAVLRLHYFPII